MATLSWTYVFRPRQAQWWVGVVFSVVGVGLALVLPAWLLPDWEGVERPAVMAHFDTNADGLARPVFRTRDDERTYASPVWSSRPAYEVGERVIIVTAADTEDWYVKADKDMQAVVWILRSLGAVFAAIGGTILLLMVLGVPDYLVQTIGGALGALSFSLPATFMLPGLWLAHRSRPNLFFGADEPFGQEQWILGGVFTVLGVIVTTAVVALGRYQLTHKTVGWSWSRSGP